MPSVSLNKHVVSSAVTTGIHANAVSCRCVLLLFLLAVGLRALRCDKPCHFQHYWRCAHQFVPGTMDRQAGARGHRYLDGWAPASGKTKKGEGGMFNAGVMLRPEPKLFAAREGVFWPSPTTKPGLTQSDLLVGSTNRPQNIFLTWCLILKVAGILGNLWWKKNTEWTLLCHLCSENVGHYCWNKT